MFHAGCTYRHPDCLDVDLYVVRVINTSPLGQELKVQYVTQNTKRLIEEDTVLVQTEDVKNWFEVEDV
jgi:hypothetical protein